MHPVFRHRPSPAMVVACLALIVALSGTGYAAIRLPARSVGAKQLKTGAVTRLKLARSAVTGAKVARNALTGMQINEATLATVPKATHASAADTATHANTADSAATAGSADAVAVPEGWHVVGAPGEPAFQHTWQFQGNTSYELPGFYKDRLGIVHLRGRLSNGAPNNVMFQLPAGYRPAVGKSDSFPASCECDTAQTTIIVVAGTGFSAGFDGSVSMQNGSISTGHYVSLDGISFKAES